MRSASIGSLESAGDPGGPAPGPRHPERAALDAHLRCSYSVCVAELRFEWDPDKATDNSRKHGVSFEEAETIFSDEFAILIYDPDHSGHEDRFLLLGMSVSSGPLSWLTAIGRTMMSFE